MEKGADLSRALLLSFSRRSVASPKGRPNSAKIASISRRRRPDLANFQLRLCRKGRQIAHPVDDSTER
jgi:hypothetical protein